MLAKTFYLAVKVLRVSGLCVDDFSIDIHRIIILEWGETCVHFVNQDSERPPVYGATVAFVQQNLRRNVLWSSANSVCSFPDNFGEAKIDHFKIAVATNHDVLRF